MVEGRFQLHFFPKICKTLHRAIASPLGEFLFLLGMTPAILWWAVRIDPGRRGDRAEGDGQ